MTGYKLSEYVEERRNLLDLLLSCAVCGVLCCDCMYAYTNRDMTSPSSSGTSAATAASSKALRRTSARWGRSARRSNGNTLATR